MDLTFEDIVFELLNIRSLVRLGCSEANIVGCDGCEIDHRFGLEELDGLIKSMQEELYR